MKDSLKEQFAKAVKFERAGQLESAKRLLVDLAEQDPQSIPTLATLGHVCYQMELWDEAVTVFGGAVKLSPSLEAVSLGLFHSLWKLGKRVEALQEAKRFQSISDSEDYQEIIDEINEKW